MAISAEAVRKIAKEYKIESVMTFGGEPLLQLDFIIDVCKRAKEAGIHTAIDTSGATFNNCDINKYDELIKYVDLFLLDIKHIDDDKCIKLTGKSNKNTISFAEYLNKNNKPVWIRYVLVPGITDNLNDLEKTKLFIDSLSNVEKVEVLPYHKLGCFFLYRCVFGRLLCRSTVGELGGLFASVCYDGCAYDYYQCRREREKGEDRGTADLFVLDLL